MRSYSIIIALLVLISCENDSLDLIDINIVDNETFSITVQQKALYNNSISLITKRIEDGRCPSDVLCIWAGNANVDVELIQNDNLVETIGLCIGNCSFGRLSSVEPDTAYFTHASENFMLILYDVIPYPNTNNQDNTKRAQLKLVRL